MNILPRQIILGDAVVWWRACVIWQNRAVYCTGPILLGLTLGTSYSMPLPPRNLPRVFQFLV